jgi:5-(carboxyamino)imidazole ribonucleotide synthase
MDLSTEQEIDVIANSSSPVILPGSTIGMVGGGQLGRMFAIAASTMGYRVVVFCGSDNDPAAQVSSHAVVGPLDDPEKVKAFARLCDVITLEFENIPAETIAKCSEFAPTYPASSVLAIAQDRLLEKTTLQNAGLPVTAFMAVDDGPALTKAAEQLGWPLIVKSARSGYDGKGQHRVECEEEANSVAWETADAWIAEQFVDFDREISVIVARCADGRCSCYPPFENQHRNHILDLTLSPAAINDDLAGQAEEIAVSAAKTLDVVGLLCVEMFVCGDRVMINEVAPRPHNSGHLTIEAFQTSQFQQHVRAVCGLPLGSPRLVCGGAAMLNLLGELWSGDTAPRWDQSLAVAGVNLHLYGKKLAKPGRKMGHLTATASNAEQARSLVVQARDRLSH